MKFVYASSDDSLDFYPKNNSFDFTVNLPHSISGNLFIALGEIYYTSHGEDLLVFCDLCEDSFIKGTSLPVLRSVSHTGEFTHLYFHSVTRATIQRIRIYITNNNLETPSADIGPVTCLLIFKEI